MRGRLLAFALLVACLGAVLSGEQPFDTRSFTVVPGDTLTITSDFGKIRVRPCEGAVLEIRSRRSTDDPSGKSMPVVDIRKEGMTIVVRSVSSGAAGEVVDLDISVPASLSVTISGANPEVDLAGLLQNPMRVQTSTGRITSVDITSDLRLVSQSGDIRYRTGLQPRGDVRLESASGSIYCELEDGLNLRNQLRAGGKIFWDMEPMLEAASLERQLGVLGPLLSG
ncbi:MAG TPA: hypothetical protein VE398_14205, partial [Acidobacteriota bacterium]|nr:hypothetical protein [Acidobacteriota bacterium]